MTEEAYFEQFVGDEWDVIEFTPIPLPPVSFDYEEFMRAYINLLSWAIGYG